MHLGRAGLANQLLAEAINHEKPELEEKKMELLKQWKTVLLGVY